ncbi:unnamed protein product, partial [Prorocentrum cordatum]
GAGHAALGRRHQGQERPSGENASVRAGAGGLPDRWGPWAHRHLQVGEVDDAPRGRPDRDEGEGDRRLRPGRLR